MFDNSERKTEYTVATLIKILTSIMQEFTDNFVYGSITGQFFRQLMHYINAVLFNTLLKKGELCRCANGIQIKMALSELERWIGRTNFPEIQ